MPLVRDWHSKTSIYAAPRLMAVVWLLMSVLVSTLSSCSKTAQEKTVKFEVLVGNNQILAPREAAKQQIEFVMTDSTGSPVPGVQVELKLLEVPEGDAELTSEFVKKLWDAANVTTSKMNPATLADKIGRIDGAKVVTTDSFGRVVVNIIAPSRFSAKIILAARTLASQVVPDLVAYASLTTTSATSLGKISLESTYENNILPAGKNAEFWLVLRDQTGAIVTSYEGGGIFRIEATRPGVSWTGLGSPGFLADVNCSFVAGRCTLPGSPFNFAKAEKLTVAVEGLAPAIERFETVVSVVKGESPSQVIAADKLGGSETRASPVRDVSLDTGQGVTLAAAWIDDGGNFLGDATDTRWFSSLPEFQMFLPTDARSTFFFKPAKTGVFKVELNSPAAKQPSLLPVEVRSGLLHAWRIETQHSGVEAAGNCFRLSITAVDEDGNAVPNIEGQIIGSLELGGITDSLPAVYDSAHFERLGLRLAKEVAAKIDFRMGTGTPSEQACLYDATSVSPKIVFSANGVTSEVPVTVLKGEPASLRLSRQNLGEASINACSTPLSPDNLGSPCINFSADEINTSTPVPISLFASLTDQAGNWISDTKSRWQITGPLGEINSNGTGKFAILGSFESEQKLLTTIAGKGTFTLTTEGGEVSPQRFAYEVVHGAVAKMKVETLEGGRQITTQPFQVKASIFDKWDNLATSFTNTLSTTVSVSPAPNSPDATPAQPTFNWPISFTNGGGIALSSQTLQLPCACNPENLPPAGVGCGDISTGGYATECPKIKVSATNLGDFYSNTLSIAPGPLKSLNIRSSGAGLGTILEPTQTIEMEIFKPLNVFFAGYDALGNFRTDTTSALSWTWTTAGMSTAASPLSQTQGSSTAVISELTGEGRLVATAITDATIKATSPTIRFKNSRAVRYSIETSSLGRSAEDIASGILREVAGRPFDIYIKALDALNNVDPNFNGARTFHFVSVSTPSWTGQMAALPDLQEITCAFASGVCIVPPQSNAANGWTIADATRPSIINFVETTPLANLPAGGTKFDGTFAASVFMNTNIAERVLLANTTGGPASGAKITATSQEVIKLTTDEEYSAYAVLVDKGGNYLGELLNPVVQGDATYVQPFMTIANANGGSKVTFAPKLKTPRTNPLSVPSTVELRLASPNSTIQPFVGNVAVYHGVPSKTVVELFPYSPSGAATTAVNSQLVAGKCYAVGAKIMDSNNNEIDTLTGTALAKLGAKNFSVSSDYLNFDGGFYKKTASGGFSSFKFSSSDPMFAGSEFTVKDRKVVAIMGTDYPAGGITSFLQTSGGNLANSDELMFCQSDASSNPSTPPRPQLVVEMVAGLSYFNKQGDRVLLSPVSGSSAAFTVVPGPAAALQFFMKIVDASGNENLGPPICPLSPVYGGPYNFGAGIWLSPISGSGSVSPQLFEDNDIADCLAMSAEKGGFNIVAKVTDVAGNVLSQTPNGTWTFLAASGTTPFAAPSGSSNFTQTGNTYRDQQRRAGMYTVEYNESTTGLKARIVAKVKAGRAASFSMYAPPTILATQGFNVSVDFRDNWGNNICEGFRGFNGTGFGRDLEFGSANNSGQVSVRWTGAIPTTPKFPVGGVLGDGTEWNATFQCANNGQHVSSRLQIPTVGVYALEADSDSLRTTSGSIIPVASTRKSSSIKVLPGAVNVTKLEYITAPGGKGYLPSTSGTELSSSPSATEASAFPYVLRSFDLSYDVGTAIGVYIAGYDLEDNFSRAIPSTLTSISANELEILASTSPDYFAVGCNQPTRVLCQMNADSGGEERGIVHILAGIRAGTTQIKLTNNENSTDVKTLPSFQIVPGTPTHLIPTAMDSSKMINGSTPGSSIQSVLAGSEMSFKLRLTDSNRNTILSHNQESLIDFQFSGVGNGETPEKRVNTRPQSRRYSFVNGVTTDTVTTKVVVTGDYFLRISSPASTYGGIIDFGTQGILPGPFHHYGANTFGPGQYGSYVAHRDLLTKFTTVIDRRDEFGNVLEPSADMVPVSLKLKSFGSTTFTGQLHGTTENIQLSTNSPTTTISDLSYPEPGLFYMDVFDNNGKSVNYIFSSPTFDIDADLTTIAGYKIEHITKNPNPAITAGESTFFKVYPTARYGSVFSIEDSLLNSLRFQWSGADNALNPTQTPPVLPTQLTFSSGTAEVPVTFFRAQSISGNLKITDIDASVGQTGTFPGTITVNPGPIADYQLQTCINNLNCGTSLKTRKAEKSIDGYFDVKISTFDAWMNPRAGEAGLKLVARKISGPVNTVAGFYASSGSNADTTVDTSNMNLRPGTLNFYNLYYPVGHTVELDIENGSVPSSVKPQIEFQYSPNSIAKYKLETSTTNVQTGPNNLQLTVSVLDRVGNVIPNLDDVLNLRSYRIDGPGYSPDGTPPKLEDNSIATLSNNWTFTQGVALKTLSLYRAETISSLAVYDNFSFEGRFATPITVQEGVVSNVSTSFYGFTGSGPRAGVPFDIDVHTTDAYGNPSEINCSAGVQVTGGSTSTGGWGGTSTAPTIPAATKISKGFFSFMSTILTKAGTESLNFSACGQPKPNIQTPVLPAAVNRMVLKTTNTVPATTELGLTGNTDAGEMSCSNSSATASSTDCGTVFAFFWDQFGNRIDSANNSCNWAWTNATASHGITIVAPSNIGGSGGSRSVSSSDFVDGTLTCSRDSVSKSVKFWGGLAKLDATANFTLNGTTITSANLPAGTQITLSGISARTSKDGVLVTLPGSENSSTKQLTIASTLPIDGLPSTASCTLVNSDCPTSYSGSLKTAGTVANISLSLHGKTLTWAKVVDPGLVNRFDLSLVPANATAGIALTNLGFVMRDQYNNPTNTFMDGGTVVQCTSANISITPAAGLTSPGGRFSTTAQAASVQSPPNSSMNIGEFRTSVTLYKAGLNNITFSGCGITTVHPISVSPANAHAGFLSNASTDAGISANATEFDCPHTSTSASNSGVSCPSINAFFIDAWGNSLNGGSPVACSWNYTNATPAAGLTAAVTPTNSGAGGTATLTASDFIDGVLSCTKDGQAPTTKIFGGVSKISLSTALTSNSTLVANDGNVSITSIQLFQRRDGSDVAKPATTSMTFKVNIDTGSSTNGFTDVVPSSDSTALPSASTISRSFNTTGVSESSITLNYKKAAVGTTNTLTVRIQGKAVAMTGLTVEPNVASSIAVTKVNSTAISGSAIPAATAGSAFSLEAEIRDQFGNPTWKSTSNANCSGTALTVSSTSGTSPGNTGAIGTATTFDPAAVTNKSTMTSSTSGNYALGNIILYAAGSKSLVLSACGLSPSFSVTVNPASAANMAINATGIGNTTRISEYECDNTGTNEVVKCAALYASFWDQYGNPRISDTCDSWAYVTNNGAPVPPYSTAAVASQTLAQLTHATDKHFDGTLTCNKSGITSNNAVLLWGGVKQVTLTTSPATIPASMTAANANLKVTNIKIETPKGGVMTTPTKSLVKPIIFKSNSGTARLSTQTSTILNGANGLSQSCTFASATASVECTPSPSYDFNFIKAETGVYLDVSVHGVAATRLGTFNVTPGNASKIVLTEVAGSAATTLGTRTAGTAFTFVSQIQDSFDNPTTLSTTGSDCSTSALTLSGGGGSSPGGTSTSIGTATAFSAAAATGTSSMNNTTSATYSVGNVILYTAGSQSLSLQACGVPATPFTVTVSPAAVANVALNKESSASNIQLTEFECENSGTGMTCPAMNAWFWDAYGNARSTDTCDSWSYATTGSAPVPPFNAATTTKAATQSVVNLTNSSASYYNGVLTCNNSRSGVGTGGTFSTSPSVRLWGGVSQVTLSHNVSGSSIAASLGNVQITNVSLRTPKDATLTAPTKNPTGATTRRIFFTTNATSAAMQNGGGTTALTAATSTSAYADCAFVAGASFADCSVSASPYRFNFTKAETGRTFDVTVQGVNATPQIGFEVTGGTANQLTVSTAPPSTVTAGADFGLNLAVKDTWNNPTSSGCGAVTITGPTASPSTGPSGTTSTSFDLSQAAGQTAPSSLGVYNISALKLYNATTQSLNISACGLNASTSPSVTVKPASPKAGTLTATNSRSTTSATELVCTNSSTSPFAVGCGSATAYAWFWDLYGNQITSSNNSTANDVNCDSWNFSQQTGVTGFTATGGTNSLSSSITQGSATAKWVDGTLSCVKTGVTSPSIVVWGGLQSVAIAAQDSSSNVITSTNPTLTAATGNLKVSQIVLKAQKGGSEVTNSNFGSTLSVTWNTDATPLASAASGGWTTSGSGTSTPFGRAQIESLTFAGGIYSSPIPFNFVKAETGRKVSASVLGVASNMVQFGVSEANVNSITLNASPTTANVGDDVTMTVSAIDAFGNPSFGNCTTATLSAASSLNAPNGTAPTLPGAALTQSGTKGTFNAGIVKFFKAGSGQTIQADACAKTANSQAVTVNAGASLQQILLTTTNAQPAYNTTLSESSDLACTTGSTVQCPTIYAYGEDAHGNPKGAVTCSSWSFAVEGSSSAPVVSNTSGTSTTVTNASTHVDGVLTCQASTLQRTVPLLGKITKTPDLSCSAWACNAGAAESTCTLSNNTGYAISGVSITSTQTPSINNCTGSLASGSNCTFTYSGTTGSSAGNTTATSTPSNTSVVILNDAIAAISGGNNAAPNCSQSLNITQSAWSCVATNTPEVTLTITNSNQLQDFQIASGSPFLDPANGGSIFSNSCGTTVSAGGQCTVTIRGTTNGSTTTFKINPASGSSFNAGSLTTTAAPSCP